MVQQKTKSIQDVKKEYGFILKNDSSTYENHYCLESVRTHEIFDIDDICALAFIKDKTFSGFMDETSKNCYNNYVSLFNLLGMRKLHDELE